MRITEIYNQTLWNVRQVNSPIITCTISSHTVTRVTTNFRRCCGWCACTRIQVNFIYSATLWLIYDLHIVCSKPHFLLVHKITAYASCWIIIIYQFNCTKKIMNMDVTKNIKVFNVIIIVILIIVEYSNANGKYHLEIQCKLKYIILSIIDLTHCFVQWIGRLFCWK